MLKFSFPLYSHHQQVPGMSSTQLSEEGSRGTLGRRRQGIRSPPAMFWTILTPSPTAHPQPMHPLTLVPLPWPVLGPSESGTSLSWYLHPCTPPRRQGISPLQAKIPLSISSLQGGMMRVDVIQGFVFQRLEAKLGPQRPPSVSQEQYTSGLF